MDAQWSLTRQILETNGQLRQDLVAVEGFDTETSQSKGDDEVMELFWGVLHPSAVLLPWNHMSKKVENIEILKDVPPLPEEFEHALLNKLAQIERSKRVPYEPDVDPGDIFDSLSTYLHVAAARALRLKRKDGYSEDVRDILNESHRVATLLRKVFGEPDWCAPAGILSVWGVAGLVLLELFQMERLDGEYEQALVYLADGVKLIAGVFDATDVTLEDLAQEFEDRGKEELQWRKEFEEGLSVIDLDPRDAEDTFELLRSPGKCEDWAKVAKNCEAVATFWRPYREDDGESDAEGNQSDWLRFWYVAKGWAEAQLSPSEYQKLKREKEEDAAEERLRKYFFEDALWGILPARAQRSLVDAERTWFCTQKGRMESCLNDLKIAAEELCYSFVWKNLLAWEDGQPLQEFIKNDKVLSKSGHQPALADYHKMSKHIIFKKWIKSMSLNETERGFLTSDFPKALDELCKYRREAEHTPQRTWEREEIASLVRRFLGVKCRGVLPRLVEIISKVSPQPVAKRPTMLTTRGPYELKSLEELKGKGLL